MVSTTEAELGITKVLALYCHVVDDGEFDRLGEVFDEQGAFIMDGAGPRGLAPLIDHFRVIQAEERRGVHVLSTPHITIDGGRARAVTDIAFYRKRSSGWQTSVVGRYIDDLVHTDVGWRIETRVFTAK
jgi:hypothetical protein